MIAVTDRNGWPEVKDLNFVTADGKQGKRIGEAYKEVDGYYVLILEEWCARGALTSSDLREIAQQLEILNKPWDDQVRADPAVSAPPPYRNESYDCSLSGHIFDRFYPANRTTVRRSCVIPKCHQSEERTVKT